MDQSKTDGNLSLLETEEKTPDEVSLIRFKLELKEFLRERPNNYSAAARKFGVDRITIERMVTADQREFEDLENEYLDDLEEKVVLSARGLKIEDFSFNEAMKILEKRRPERWSTKGAKTSVRKAIAPLDKGLISKLLTFESGGRPRDE